MHPAVQDATGYTLLLSSFVALAILLRKGCKRKGKWPFYILSISDVFGTILTAVTLLANRIETVIRLNYNTDDAPNRTWIVENGSYHRLPFLQIHNLRTANDRDVNLTCDMRDILMQYGMLLAALTNAFISLLTLAAQCNFNATCVKRRCIDAVKSSVSNVQSAEIARPTEREEEQATSRLGVDDINARKKSGIAPRMAKILKFRALEDDDKKPACFLVTCHWLVPFLIVGILYFARYSDMNSNRQAEDTECIFESNFPMSNFHMSTTDVEGNLEIIGSIIHTTSEKDNYFLNEEYSNMSKPSSVEVNEIVSRVQNIVRTALNYTSNSAGNTSTHDSSGTKKYAITNNIISYLSGNTNINSVMQGSKQGLTKQNTSVHDSNKNNDVYLDQEETSRDASEGLNATGQSQVSFENKIDSYRQDVPITYFSTEENTTPRAVTTGVTVVRNRTTTSNLIYDDIIKRIQAAVKSSNRSKNRHEELPKRNDLNYIARKPNSIRNLPPSKDDNPSDRYVDAETQSGSLRAIDECLVSTDFLKLHLFVSFIAIYFLPILFCCVLYTRGKYICKNALAILKAQADLVSPPSRKSGVDSNADDNGKTVVDLSRLEFRPDDRRPDRRDSMMGSDKSQILKDETDRRVMRENRQSCGEARNRGVALEAKCMVRIFDIVKLSLILCVVLWTPAFLGTLLRVFTCIRAPQWLTDTTFLSAISFDLVRNILNINIIKVQEICGDANARENRIHPIK